MDLNPDRITPPPGNPGVGMSSKVLVHPSHICQIGESDQGHFELFSRPAISRNRSSRNHMVIADLEETANNVPGFEVPKAISLLTEYDVLKYEWPSYRPE
jgi:hypothetical protein